MQQRFRLSRVVLWRIFPVYSPSCTALALLDMLSCVVAAAHVCLIVSNMQDTIGQIRSDVFLMQCLEELYSLMIYGQDNMTSNTL